MKLLLISIVMFILVGGSSCVKPSKYPRCCPFNIDICKNNTNSDKDKEERIFPGLFVNKTFLEKNNKSVGTIMKRMKFNITVAEEEGQPVNRIKRETRCNCCETEFFYSAIMSVYYEGKEHDVVQYEDIGSYQILTEGDCQISECSSSYTCQTMYKLVWMLIKIECSWSPAMKFVPVLSPSHCECRT
ncbi:uncharacterized protein LOC117334937 [Pecten maximus]|uniref:uncharacterized protein LOC117334937 n=1 Tax=Pecten maximus TaxID=6579 RepID=UPI001458D12D|nr:uncharacterized protein LOC117334937 [Pecten maximus]